MILSLALLQSRRSRAARPRGSSDGWGSAARGLPEFGPEEKGVHSLLCLLTPAEGGAIHTVLKCLALWRLTLETMSADLMLLPISRASS